jgi:hypothetical protein
VVDEWDRGRHGRPPWDAADATGGAPLQAPLLAHPEFERLEAGGIAREGEADNRAMEIVRKLPRPGGNTLSEGRSVSGRSVGSSAFGWKGTKA